jgi:hypothetical protein
MSITTMLSKRRNSLVRRLELFGLLDSKRARPAPDAGYASALPRILLAPHAPAFFLLLEVRRQLSEHAVEG